MVLIANLKNYAAQVSTAIPEIKSCYLAVTRENLMKFMQDHEEDKNIMMVTLLPEHDMAGQQDAAQWVNTIGFYFLEKTDYSEHDHDSYISIFERTQQVAKAFVIKLLNDKSDNTGLFCQFLSFLDENSISVSPVSAINQCNGYYVQLTLKSNA